jgi:signal transduction histidine kinase
MRIRAVPRGLRRRIALAVILAAAAAMAAMIAGFNVLLAHSLSRNADDRARARAAAVLSTLETVNGRLVVPETSDQAAVDPGIWVFSGNRALEQPRVVMEVSRAARALAAGPERIVDVPGKDTRLYALPVIVHGARLGTVVSAVSLEPYEQTSKTALIGSLALGALLLALLAVTARWLLGAALRPVERMTADAAAWSERDLDRRFSLGEPHDELTHLAATLDGLLDRIAASLRREQRFSAEISHELRTPLARIRTESDLALRRQRSDSEYRGALETIRRHAGELETTIETLVLAGQQNGELPRGTGDAYAAAMRAVEACSSLAAESNVTVAVERPSALVRVGADGDVVTRILQPLIENACKYGRSRVRVSPARSGSRVLFMIEDDGPGVRTEERERIFQPGIRGTSGHSSTNGAGLGLALSRRLARSVDGDVEAVPAPTGGSFTVALPAG